MKLVLVTETYPPDVNGVAMTLQRLVRVLTRRGHDLRVVRPGSGDGAPHADGARVEHVRGLPIPCYPELRFGLPAGRRLLRAWRRERPDLVHVATEGPLGRSAVRAAERLALPLTTSFHTNFHLDAGHYGFGPLARMSLGWLRRLHARAACTFVPTEAVRQTLRAAGFEHLEVLGRGVDRRLFTPARRDPDLRRSWGAAPDTPVALYVGRLATEKNLDLTVRAFQVLRTERPDARFVLVGDGPLRARLARAHPDFRFTGLLRGERLAAHYASGDVFLFASETETFGNVVTEAMASGLLVLAYDHAAAGQVIESGASGLTVPLGDARAYLGAARDLARQPGLWEATRRRARAATAPIGWSGIADVFERHLRRVAAGTLRS